MLNDCVFLFRTPMLFDYGYYYKITEKAEAELMI